MDYATMQSILGWAAIAAALVAGGIVGAMLVYDLGKPLWRRLARLWRRSPVECVAAVSLLCYCVAWGGGKITFPRTNAEYELLKDAGSYATNDTLHVAYTAHAILPDTADLQVYRRAADSTNDADWAAAWASTVGASPSPFDLDIEGATNWNYAVFTTWQPAPAVQTNGVLHVDWVVAANAETAAASTHALAVVPLKSTVAVDGAEAWPNADFDPAPVTARSYVQDGLVAMWDGIENAGWGVHDNNAAVWKDLIGENDLQFSKRWGNASGYSAEWRDNCAVKTNNVDFGGWAYIKRFGTATTQPQVFGEVAQTIEIRVWIDENVVASGSAMLVCNMNQAAESIYIVIYPARNYLAMRRSTSDFTGTLQFSHTYPFASPHTISVTRANTGYCDGEELQRSTVVDNWSDRTQFYIGGENYGKNRSFTGRIYSVRIYDRALTAEEIAHNAAIDRRRFGTAADAE